MSAEDAGTDTAHENINQEQDETATKYMSSPMNFEIHRADTTSDIYENENIPQEEDFFAEKEEAYADTVSGLLNKRKCRRMCPLFRRRRHRGSLRGT